MVGRATRLCKFFLLGCWLLWANFYESQRSQKVWATVSTIKTMNNFLQIMGWATFWAIFFTNSSGHPDGGPPVGDRCKHTCPLMCDIHDRQLLTHVPNGEMITAHTRTPSSFLGPHPLAPQPRRSLLWHMRDPNNILRQNEFAEKKWGRVFQKNGSWQDYSRQHNLFIFSCVFDRSYDCDVSNATFRMWRI
jgi:hypothetical protein